MRKNSPFVSFLLVLSLALQPVASFARAGGSFSRSGSASSHSAGSPSRSIGAGTMTYQSQGSRGSRTSAPVAGAQPIARSSNAAVEPIRNNNAGLGSSVSRTNQQTPVAGGVPVPSLPAAAVPARAPAAAPLAAPSFAQNHPVLTGVLAGVGGAWLYNTLFNHNKGTGGMTAMGGSGGTGSMGASGNFDAAPMSAGPSTMGMLLNLLVVAALGYGLFRGVQWFMARRRKEQDYLGHTTSTTTLSPDVDATHTVTTGAQNSAYGATSDDQKVFAALLERIQSAWSTGDLPALSALATGEMVHYFKEDLDGNASQKVRNIVDNVRNIRVVPKESWREGKVVYATCTMAWEATDYVIDATKTAGEPGYVVDGDPNAFVHAEEVWTFACHDDGDWILSAVQQVR